ncbi:MAG: response regulator [Thiomargarita sp.]|nr:response regulator [Thiomargarita sp.]
MSQVDKKIEILIVDDNKNNLLSLNALIEEYFDDVKVIEAESGIIALSLLMRKSVDFILLDIQMPQMDGFETAKIIQTRSKTKHIPIVFLTAAYKSEKFQKKGFEVGAVDYLTKPIEPMKLVNKLKTYFRFIHQDNKQVIEEEVIVEKVQKRVTALSQDSKKQGSLDHKLITDISQKLQHSLKALIEYNEAFRKGAIELDYKDCLPDIYKMSWESKQLLALVKKCES